MSHPHVLTRIIDYCTVIAVRTLAVLTWNSGLLFGSIVPVRGSLRCFGIFCRFRVSDKDWQQGLNTVGYVQSICLMRIRDTHHQFVPSWKCQAIDHRAGHRASCVTESMWVQCPTRKARSVQRPEPCHDDLKIENPTELFWGWLSESKAGITPRALDIDRSVDTKPFLLALIGKHMVDRTLTLSGVIHTYLQSNHIDDFTF